jgi:hypothetical protein
MRGSSSFERAMGPGSHLRTYSNSKLKEFAVFDVHQGRVVK